MGAPAITLGAKQLKGPNMKAVILTVVGAAIIVGLLLVFNRPGPMPVSPPTPVVEAVPTQQVGESQAVEPVASKPERAALAAPAPVAAKPAPAAAAPPSYASLEASNLNEAVDLLVSPQATYEQKQATWKQLREAGKLDQAIAELERRTAGDPRVAEYPAALGQAYLQKCGTIQDVREQGFLALQADKVFDTALNLDPSNWEARFTKAMAMSYWPSNMNKGPEVIQHFQTLVQQQETQPAQPQFATTYVWLGDQYAKAGHSDYARTVWERGAALFPNNDALKNKLAASQ